MSKPPRGLTSYAVILFYHVSLIFFFIYSDYLFTNASKSSQLLASACIYLMGILFTVLEIVFNDTFLCQIIMYSSQLHVRAIISRNMPGDFPRIYPNVHHRHSVNTVVQYLVVHLFPQLEEQILCNSQSIKS